MATTASRLSRLSRGTALVGASLLLSGVAFTPAALATTDPNAHPGESVQVSDVLDPLNPRTCFGRPVTLVVPPGGAPFYGSPDPNVIDVILGTSGEDHIVAQDGDDFICGGGAWDHIEGGPGRDWIDGEGDGDSLYGGEQNDVIYGGEETDLLMGDEGNDILYGQRGDDELYCGDGQSDVADGGKGDNDFIFVPYDGCESVVNVP